jgi:hypothetical protein
MIDSSSSSSFGIGVTRKARARTCARAKKYPRTNARARVGFVAYAIARVDVSYKTKPETTVYSLVGIASSRRGKSVRYHQSEY